MKKKKKVNKKKFISRIIFLIVLIVIIIFVIKSFEKEEKQKYDISVFINNQNITNDLSDEPYINKDNVLYLSLEDIRKIFDSNIYYEEESRRIITTYGTKTAAIDVDNNTLTLNTANFTLNDGILDYGNNVYFLPVSDFTNIYNIEAFTTQKSAIISSLYDEFVTVKTTSKISIKKESSSFSHTIQKVDKDTELIYIEDSDKKGWIKVLDFNRKFGICKK